MQGTIIKIVAISDTHSYHRRLQIPECDLLVHAGDITFNGEYRVLADFNSWLGTLSQCKRIVCIAGNHDRSLEQNPGLTRGLLSHAVYLQDQSAEIEGLLIYGSPWCPRFGDWSFYDDRGPAMARHWIALKDGHIKPDVLVTHGPPHGILDLVDRGEHVGCEELMIAVNIAKPKIHIFGHVHDGYGRYRSAIDTTLFVNASTCNESYQPMNPPQIITI